MQALTQSLPLPRAVPPPVLSSVAVRTPLPAVTSVPCAPPLLTTTAASSSASASIRPPFAAAAATPSTSVHAPSPSPARSPSLDRAGSLSRGPTSLMRPLQWSPAPAWSSLASPPSQLRESPYSAAASSLAGPSTQPLPFPAEPQLFSVCSRRRSIRSRLPSRLRLTRRGTS